MCSEYKLCKLLFTCFLDIVSENDILWGGKITEGNNFLVGKV